MKSVLIVCLNFIPYHPSFGSVARVVSLVEYLHQKQYNVYVLTSKGHFFNYHGHDEINNKAEILYVDDFINERLGRALSSEVTSSTDSSNQEKTRLKKTVKFLVSYCVVPDLSIFIVPRYYLTAIKIIRQHRIKNLIVSSPPHSMQIVGHLLKRKLKKDVNVIADYRDSWNTRDIYRKRSSLFQYISEKIEKKILLSCDLFSYVSSPMLKNINHLFGFDLTNKSILVMNGFTGDPVPYSDAPLSNGNVRIGYFGSVSDSDTSVSNVSNIVDAISEMREQELNFLVEFYGVARFSKSKTKNCQSMTYRGSLSHGDVSGKMSEMDFLLLIYSDAESSDEVITGKFFEYVAARKPIVCIGPKNMEVFRIIQQENLGVCVDIDDLEAIKGLLKSLPQIKYSDFNLNGSLDKYRRSYQFEKLEQFLV